MPPWSGFLGAEHDQRAERLVLAWVLLCAHPLVATLLGSALSWKAASPADADKARDLVRKWTDRGVEKLSAMGCPPTDARSVQAHRATAVAVAPARLARLQER